ncbi:MAG TPA: DUF2163 domain-containing protein [Rhodoblastus sp.]|nr:DUF2163 domain-containing protein [Rhodoblastus sp.]
MRDMDAATAGAFAGDATTLCHCWRLTRRDGAVLGFTDHDCDLAFAGAIFRAGAGLDAAQAESAAGFAVAGGEVQGAFDDEALVDADLDAGVYDGASVEIWLVDWSDVSRRVLMDIATIGEVRRTEFSFVAELRSLAHRFDEEQGRQFQRNCSADLGDAACRVDLSSPLYSTAATIASVETGGAFVAALDSAFDAGFFTDGALLSAKGERHAIKLHEKAAQGDRIVLWGAASSSLAAGARVTLKAGCDKSPDSCARKFDNIVNFRGFPHMPGNDVVAAYPNASGPPMDGGSLFR